MRIRLLGDLTPEERRLVKDECSSVKTPPFRAFVSGLELVEAASGIPTLSAGIEPCPGLTALVGQASEALARALGFPQASRRPLRMILGRIDDDPLEAQEIVKALGDAILAHFEVNALQMCRQSRWSPGGPDHLVVTSWPLVGEVPPTPWPRPLAPVTVKIGGRTRVVEMAPGDQVVSVRDLHDR
jgi:hypothetical protein